MARRLDPEKYQKILTSARETFLRDGFDDARVAEIAEDAGLAVGTLYLYFDSKEAMAQALAEGFFGRMTGALEGTLSNLSKPGNIARLVDAALAEAGEDIELMRAGRMPEGPSARIRRDFEKMAAEKLAGQMERGEIRAHDPEALAKLLAAMVETAVYESLVWRTGDLETYRDTLISVFERTLLN